VSADEPANYRQHCSLLCTRPTLCRSGRPVVESLVVCLPVVVETTGHVVTVTCPSSSARRLICIIDWIAEALAVRCTLRVITEACLHAPVRFARLVVYIAIKSRRIPAVAYSTASIFRSGHEFSVVFALVAQFHLAGSITLRSMRRIQTDTDRCGPRLRCAV